jgi:hypothetical protein
VTRAFFFAAVLFLAGCATPPKGEVVIRPSPQRQATHQVVGETIVASLGGAAVTVQWLAATGVEQYFESRPGLVYPWPKEIWKVAPPTIFFLRLRNQTPDEVQFDPTLATLVTQDGRHEYPVSYEEMYQHLEGTEASGPRLQSLQATLFSRFVVIPPGGQREGLLAFPMLGPDAKHLLLEFASFFVGGRNVPGLFEFQVLREKNP